MHPATLGAVIGPRKRDERFPPRRCPMILPRYKLIAIFVMLLIGGIVSDGVTREVGITSSLKGMKGVHIAIVRVKELK